MGMEWRAGGVKVLRLGWGMWKEGMVIAQEGGIQTPSPFPQLEPCYSWKGKHRQRKCFGYLLDKISKSFLPGKA